MPEPHSSYNPGYYSSSYGPPPGPPLSYYSAPPGPPPSGFGPPPGAPYSGYNAPPGPPPSSCRPPRGPLPGDRGGFSNQQYHQQHQQHQQQYQEHQRHQQYPQSGYPEQHAYSGYPGQHNVPPGHAYHQGPPPPPPHVQNYGPQGAGNRDEQRFFQYSQCTGKKKALCIGINYFGQDAELRGCINDANNMRSFLCTQFGYKEEDIITLTDDSTNLRMMPTRENMLQAMQWLVHNAASHDSLFFHYSGHGGQTKDLIGDKADGYDDVIYPVDFEANGSIIDDLLFRSMVQPLPAGCRLTAIFDCCHSGTALDLPYVYSTEGKIKEPNLLAEAGQDVLEAVTSYARHDMHGVFRSAMDLVKTTSGHSEKADQIAKATRTRPADVISWSGCKDSQTSADAEEAGSATGAMTHAFISVLSANPHQSYQQLLVGIRESLKNKYSQKPQLSSCHPMDTHLLFTC